MATEAPMADLFWIDSLHCWANEKVFLRSTLIGTMVTPKRHGDSLSTNVMARQMHNAAHNFKRRSLLKIWSKYVSCPSKLLRVNLILNIWSAPMKENTNLWCHLRQVCQWWWSNHRSRGNSRLQLRCLKSWIQTCALSQKPHVRRATGCPESIFRHLENFIFLQNRSDKSVFFYIFYGRSFHRY